MAEREIQGQVSSGGAASYIIIPLTTELTACYLPDLDSPCRPRASGTRAGTAGPKYTDMNIYTGKMVRSLAVAIIIMKRRH